MARQLFLRSNLTIGYDDQRLIQLARSTNDFHKEEINLLEELFTEHDSLGPDTCYQFLILEEDPAIDNVLNVNIHHILGFTCYGHIHGTENRYTLYWIVVASEEQHKGYGTKLLQTTEDMVRSAGGCRLYVETSSKQGYTPSQRFYEHCGYREVARVSQYYNDTDDLVHYCKFL